MAASRDYGLALNEKLSVREKGLLFTLLGCQCKLVTSAVAQLLVSTEMRSGDLSWSVLSCGVVCLIEDHSAHSHFLRLYCLTRARLLWEQELYVPFQYTAVCSFFHTFLSDDCQACLNFADEVEAEAFCVAVETCIQNTQEGYICAIPIPVALKKGPLPAVPSLARSTSSLGENTLSPLPHWIPPPPSIPAPGPPERIKNNISFKPLQVQRSFSL